MQQTGIDAVVLDVGLPDLNGRIVTARMRGAEAVELTRVHRPDVILMDIRMPVMDGLEATRRVVEPNVEPAGRVLSLTTFDLDEYVFAALKAGTSGFLLKDTPPADLLTGVRIIATGEALLAPSITKQLIQQYVRRPEPPPQLTDVQLDALTDRETEVLAHVAKGWSNAEIAAKLYVTTATVKTHLSRLLMKLGARDRAQLIIAAYESGLVSARRPQQP